MLFSVFERTVALRYLRARRAERFVSVIAGFSLLGIALGVATLIIVMAVMNGFRQELLGRVLGLNGHVNIYASEGPITNYDPIVTEARKILGVANAAPVVEAQALINLNGTASGAIIKGIRLEDLKQRPTLSQHINEGSLANFKGQTIFIGERMAERLNLHLGDSLPLIGPRGTPGPFGTQPRMASYQVAGIFETGMYEYDNSFIFMPLDTAQVFFRLPSAATSVELFAQNPELVQSIKEKAWNLWPTFRVLTWQDNNSSFFSALEVERNVMFLILSLIILVAAFNIISSMIMLVKDKGRDIAILRTMGATQGMILRIFFLTGASIGIVGTLAGLLLGITFAENIEAIRQGLQAITGWHLFPAEVYFLTHLPAQVDYHEVFNVTLMAIFLSFGATLYPAWRAARLDPVEALRYE